MCMSYVTSLDTSKKGHFKWTLSVCGVKWTIKNTKLIHYHRKFLWPKCSGGWSWLWIYYGLFISGGKQHNNSRPTCQYHTCKYHKFTFYHKYCQWYDHNGKQQLRYFKLYSRHVHRQHHQHCHHSHHTQRGPTSAGILRLLSVIQLCALTGSGVIYCEKLTRHCLRSQATVYWELSGMCLNGHYYEGCQNAWACLIQKTFLKKNTLIILNYFKNDNVTCVCTSSVNKSIFIIHG